MANRRVEFTTEDDEVVTRSDGTLTAAEVKRADDLARRPDGTIDSIAFGAAIARPLGIQESMARRALEKALAGLPVDVTPSDGATRDHRGVVERQALPGGWVRPGDAASAVGERVH